MNRMIFAVLILLGTGSLAGAETATFSMYCYWTGEATLGRLPGIFSSRIGHQNGKEVVQVDYDPAVTSVATLVAALKKQNSFYAIEANDPRPHFIESKHSLRARHPELYYLDLTETQAIALNSWSYFGGRMPDVLTTEQNRNLARMKSTLRKKSPGGLSPARSGKELVMYRTQLLQWLDE